MPNQKASYYSAHDNIIVDNVDAYKYTSWKDGILIFRNESFLSLSKKIERWYDVNISFVNEELKNLRFTGVIREGKTIEHILTLIQSTNPISFEINGQNIILDKKENE
jgi:ferric-dicitrate binding protein FerR (iron transport regulator)